MKKIIFIHNNIPDKENFISYINTEIDKFNNFDEIPLEYDKSIL